MASAMVVFDQFLAREGVLCDASGVLIGAVGSEQLKRVLRAAEACGISYALDSSERLILTPAPADTGTA